VPRGQQTDPYGSNRGFLTQRGLPEKDTILTCTRKTDESREASVTIYYFVEAILTEVSVIFRRPLIDYLDSLSRLSDLSIIIHFMKNFCEFRFSSATQADARNNT
jgi:hypothetical protein